MKALAVLTSVILSSSTCNHTNRIRSSSVGDQSLMFIQWRTRSSWQKMFFFRLPLTCFPFLIFIKSVWISNVKTISRYLLIDVISPARAPFYKLHKYECQKRLKGHTAYLSYCIFKYKTIPIMAPSLPLGVWC